MAERSEAFGASCLMAWRGLGWQVSEMNEYETLMLMMADLRERLDQYEGNLEVQPLFRSVEKRAQRCLVHRVCCDIRVLR